MDNSSVEEYSRTIGAVVEKKKFASEVLSRHFGCNKREIFYRFLQEKIPESGEIPGGIKFYFHGYGCTIKDDREGWSVDLEFGPKGDVCAFDRYTICRLLGHGVDDCDSLVKILVDKNIIRLVDEALYKITQGKSKCHEWSSVEQEMDACVADRYKYLGSE